MPHIHHKYERDFTQVSNQLSRDTDLSYKARGIFLYLWSLSGNWTISLADLEMHSAKDGQDSVRTGVRELEQKGYVSFQRTQSLKTGQLTDIVWTLDDRPCLDNPNMVRL